MIRGSSCLTSLWAIQLSAYNASYAADVALVHQLSDFAHQLIASGLDFLGPELFLDLATGHLNI
jgi:hypothetical protein